MLTLPSDQTTKRLGRHSLSNRLHYQPILQAQAVNVACCFEQFAVGVAQPAIEHNGIGVALHAVVHAGAVHLVTRGAFLLVVLRDVWVDLAHLCRLLFRAGPCSHGWQFVFVPRHWHLSVRVPTKAFSINRDFQIGSDALPSHFPQARKTPYSCQRQTNSIAWHGALMSDISSLSLDAQDIREF